MAIRNLIGKNQYELMMFFLFKEMHFLVLSSEKHLETMTNQ